MVPCTTCGYRGTEEHNDPIDCVEVLLKTIRKLRLAIEAHHVQCVGWRETTEVDRELWEAGIEA